MDRIPVSALVIAYNDEPNMRACLESITWADEIIVVDNASSDGSARAVGAWPGVQVIESPTNRGFAAANNTGIRQSTGLTEI